METATNTIAHLLRPENCSQQSSYWFLEWLINWTLSSPHKLREAERFLLSHLRTSYTGFYVDIGPCVGKADEIWTISFNTDSKEIPLIALHGLGSGLALWVMNLDELAKQRPVYAIDLLGFGRSSRPQFSNDPHRCEQQIVESFEEWRRELKIRRMILMGHSMGAFIATSYALTYPDRVKHLILVDPWGFAEKPANPLKTVPLWVRIIGRISLWLNPYWLLRAVGPFGMWLLRASTSDIFHSFNPLLGSNIDMLTQYLHQCNAATPSGEAAFHTLSQNFAFAKHPMIKRITELNINIGITFIYGSSSWVDSTTGIKIKSKRKNAFVEVSVVDGAGHHIHIEKPLEFNQIVMHTCKTKCSLQKDDRAFNQFSQLFQHQKQYLENRERDLY